MGVVRQHLGDRGFDFVFKRRTRAKRDGTLIAWSRLRWRPAALPGARGVITSGQAHVASVEYNDIASDIEATGVELSPREYMTDSVGVMVRHIHSPRGVKRGTFACRTDSLPAAGIITLLLLLLLQVGLQSVRSSANIVVAATHLYWNPEKAAVKLAQVTWWRHTHARSPCVARAKRAPPFTDCSGCLCADANAARCTGACEHTGLADGAGRGLELTAWL